MEWYSLTVNAQWAGVAMWELANQPIIFYNWINTIRNAIIEAGDATVTVEKF